MSGIDEPPKKPRPRAFDDNYGRVAKSKKHENRLAKVMGGRRLPRSGGTSWSKWDKKKTAEGDIKAPTLHIEHKHTENASMSLKREWLEKVCQGARSQGKDPAVFITFDDAKSIPPDWALVPLDVLQRLLELSKEK